MSNEKFNRNVEHKNIRKINVTVKGNPEERYKEASGYARKHSDRPVSTNWSEYEKLDAIPEKV